MSCKRHADNLSPAQIDASEAIDVARPRFHLFLNPESVHDLRNGLSVRVFAFVIELRECLVCIFNAVVPNKIPIKVAIEVSTGIWTHKALVGIPR